jgi:hypothetical protein
MKKIAIVASVVVFCVFSGLFIKHQIEVKAEKKRFTNMQTWLKSTADRIAATNGFVQRTSEASCGRSSVKFGQGERDCGASEYIIYTDKTDTPEDIMSISSHAERIIAMNLQEMTSDRVTMQLQKYRFNRYGIGCFLSLYDNTQRIYSLPRDFTGKQEGLLLVIECGDRAMADYFPSRD